MDLTFEERIENLKTQVETLRANSSANLQDEQQQRLIASFDEFGVKMDELVTELSQLGKENEHLTLEITDPEVEILKRAHSRDLRSRNEDKILDIRRQFLRLVKELEAIVASLEEMVEVSHEPLEI